MATSRCRAHGDSQIPPVPARAHRFDAIAHHRHAASGGFAVCGFRDLAAGSTPASTRSIPAWRATASAVAARSPVIIHTSDPHGAQARTASAASLDGVGNLDGARHSAIDSHSGPGRPTIIVRAPHARPNAWPAWAENWLASASAKPARRAASTMAFPADVRIASAEAARRRPRRSRSNLPLPVTRVTAGLPAVTVPVYPSTNGAILCAISSASPPLIRMPRWAPRPCPP